MEIKDPYISFPLIGIILRCVASYQTQIQGQCIQLSINKIISIFSATPVLLLCNESSKFSILSEIFTQVV